MKMSTTERLKSRRQMAAATGKKSTTSLSLSVEAYGLEVEEELSPRPLSIGQKELGLENGITNNKERG